MIDAVEASRPKTELRRQQILDAACACVRRAGFHGASMAEIAKAAGLSVGQIYRYFENKEAIVAAIVAQDLAEMREKFAEFSDGDGALTEMVIQRCPEAIERNYDPDRAALVLEVLAEAARNPRVAAIVQEADAVERTLGRTVLDAARAAGCSEAELDARGEILSMIFDGMVTRAVNHPGGDRAAIALVLRSVMRHLLSDKPLSEAPFAPQGSAAP
ncbi:TetR/AcrR family transcriptional regulator [Phenylobacterium aquaticum]|uniref:TetR/AcrR family transcriptional regulator n=1 Tax=Phenylobacterium aquaticum TaxID=1763816 RepID=UPI001F5CAFE4|nr:TetR/AcrR family transcriptional regulator [Phenylobacterium aquaticum]MCI3133586.1 TetR/AcrR family transcriptional regulator [Phenylobacterium aquaticum]